MQPVDNCACLRERGLLARYGVEEFVLLMPQTGITVAVELADTSVPALLLDRWPVKAGVSVPVTICMGVSALRSDVTSLAELLKRADIVLYQAKSNGRN